MNTSTQVVSVRVRVRSHFVPTNAVSILNGSVVPSYLRYAEVSMAPAPVAPVIHFLHTGLTIHLSLHFQSPGPAAY